MLAPASITGVNMAKSQNFWMLGFLNCHVESKISCLISQGCCGVQMQLYL